MKDLRKHLAKNDTSRAAIVVGFFAHWHGQHGARAILDGEREGWAHIDRAFHYLWLKALIVERSMQASEAACVLATAVVFDEDAMAEPLAARLIQSLDEQKLLHGLVE